MALTPEEQAELSLLEIEEARRLEIERGQTSVQRTQQARQAARPPRPFSLYRFAVNSVGGALEGLENTWADLDDWSARSVISAREAMGWDASGLRADFNRRAGPDGSTRSTLYVRPEGTENAGQVERIATSIGQFLVPFAGAAKAIGGLRAATLLGRVGRGLTAGAAADFVQLDPVGNNLANILRDDFGISSGLLDSLASDPDDENVLNRFRSAAAGAPLGVGAELLIEGGARVLRGYRAWRGTAEEAAGTLDALRTDLNLNPAARNLPDLIRPADNAGAGAADDAATSGADEAASGTRAFRPDYEFRPTEEVRDFEDVLTFLRGKAGEVDMDIETFERFARNLMDGDPENALAKLGIDPARLDYSKFDDPDMLGRFHAGLAELYEGLAKKLGRSGQRVTERETVRAARSLASTPEILKSLYGATSNLAETLMGARLFVGGHAHKLLSDADAALKEIADGGGTGEAWTQFLQSFYRHAYFMGSLRGAGSEVGRALRSLQFIGRVGKKQAGRNFDEALKADAQAAAPSVDQLSIREGAETLTGRLTTDADRLRFLSDLIRDGGDVEKLTRTVRRENMSVLRRVGDALKETMGNLFGSATAVYNIASGAAMLGLNVTSRGLGAIGRTALAPFSAKQAANARRAWLDTWAYGEGVIGGFREAYANTLAVLDREGMAEASLNANSLGLDKLARQAAQRSANAARNLTGGNFERADTLNYRSFAVTPAEQQRLTAKIAELGGPRFFQATLQATARVLSSTVNAAGSLSRLGTTLFINLPDEFVGTLASRAGAYSEGVRIAAKEAAQLGLEGPQLSTYLKARATQLFGDGPKGWADDAFGAGQREAANMAGEVEARAVLFQDDLEWQVSRFAAQGLGRIPLMHMVVPFIKTPLRILERTAIDNTPLGLFKDRVRRAILAGGPEGDEALARIGLGTMAVFTAYQLADDRTIIGYDEGARGSARLSRPSYTLRVGDDLYEFNRLDPIGTLLGMGADLRAYLDESADDPDASNIIQQVTEAFIWAASTNMLSKTWLSSLRNLTDLAQQSTDERFSSRMDMFLGSFATRFVPASGVQRTIEQWSTGQQREALTFSERLIASSIGASALPVRRDRILGRPVDLLDGQVAVGAKVGPQTEDPLARELEQLAFSGPTARRTQRDVKLNATQFSRYLELRGQVVRDPQTGLTLEESLTELIALPQYQGLTRDARIDEIRKAMDGYGELATDALLQEDQSFLTAALREEVWKMSNLQGWTSEQRDAEFGRQLGFRGIAAQ